VTEALVCEFADALAGKIVIDATNPINPSLTKAARLLEPLAMLWVQLALKHHDRDFAFVVARRDAANRRAKPRVRVVHSHPQEVD
jgi:hypothetical protein